jgi:heavy metal sensor kinase
MTRGSVRARLVVWYLVVLSAGMFLLGGLVWVLLRHAMLQSLDETLSARHASFVRFLVEESHGSDIPALREEAREYSTGLPAGHSLRVWTADGTLLFAAGEADSSRAAAYRVRSEQAAVRGHRLSIELGTSLEEVDQTLGLLRAILLWCIPLVMTVASLGGWWIGGQALKPLDALTAAAETIGLRELSSRLPVLDVGDELRRLIEAWNRMLDRIAASVQRMKRFTADAAHELRTPVTIVVGTAELALRRDRDADEYRKALQGILEEGKHLAYLAEELMWLARADADALSPCVEDVPVQRLIADVQRAGSVLAEPRGVSLETEDGAVETWIRCDPRSMRRCLLILVDNAIKYTPAGGRVRIAVEPRPDACRIEVHDTGCGIEPQHLPHIFQRFYQADKSPSNSGLGLGLAIAKGIVESQQGRIGVSSLVGAGSCFFVELPRSAPSVTAAAASA